MKEDDEEVCVPWIQDHRNSRSGRSRSDVSAYQSIQSNLNAGSVHTLYQSLHNISLNGIGSMSSLNSMHSVISLEEIQQTCNEDDSTINNDTNETVIEGSCSDLRNRRGSRAVNHLYTEFIPF